MHGRLKVKTSAEQEEEKRKERQEKAELFLIGSKKAFHKRNKGELDEEALLVTEQLLGASPDFYTIWNYRREIILERIKCNEARHVKEESHEEQLPVEGVAMNEGEKVVGDDEEMKMIKLFENELRLTANCLMKNPKSYCAWHQRAWIIQHMPHADLNRELMLCKQFLEMDERNFHCWDYRRIICDLANIVITDELDFTLEKIKQNFSNFSSWYYRSCLFTRASNEKMLDFTQNWNSEYELVQNALFTDPTDQSPWFYHKWLVFTHKGQNLDAHMQTNPSIQIIRIVLQPIHSRIIILLSRPIKYAPLISLTVNQEHLNDITWSSPLDSNVSSIWLCSIDGKNQDSIFRPNITLSFRPLPTFAINPECIHHLDVTISGEPKNRSNHFNVLERKQSLEIYCVQNILGQENFESLKCLQEMEPENKWVNLTLAWLDIDIDRQINVFKKLISLDPLRINYYNDQISHLLIKKSIPQANTGTNLTLCNLNLTAMFECDKLSHIQYLDVSNNKLKRLSVSFNSLVTLEVLICDDNQISAIQKGLKCDKLKVLSLNNNAIKTTKQLLHLENCLELTTLRLIGNPIVACKSLNDQAIQQSLSKVNIITQTDQQQSGINLMESSKVTINYQLF